MAKLYFYYASMNAGKSTTLLQADFNYRERGMRTLLFTAVVDDRAGVGVIASRIGLAADAVAFDAATDLRACIEKELANAPLHCILVDEAQFLSEAQVDQLAAVCAPTSRAICSPARRGCSRSPIRSPNSNRCACAGARRQ